MRAQPRIKGVVRISISCSMHPKLLQQLKAESKRFGVSKGWILCYGYSRISGFKEQPDYKLYEVKKKRRAS